MPSSTRNCCATHCSSATMANPRRVTRRPRFLRPKSAPMPISCSAAIPSAAPKASLVASIRPSTTSSPNRPARTPAAAALPQAAGDGSGEAVDYEQFVAARPTLADHLAEQVGHLIADPAERLVARYLIDGLNEA